MTGLSLHGPLTPRAQRPAVYAPQAAAPAPLTAAEADRIASAFPERPAVAQKLYGPGREVTQATPLGTRIDLSA